MPLVILNRWFALPLLSGLLCFLCLPKAGVGMLAWVALAPLAVYTARCDGPGKAFLGGLAFGVVQNGGLLLWVPPVMTQFGGLSSSGSWTVYGLLVLLQASFPAVSCTLTRVCIRWGGIRCLLAFPFAWVCMEFLESHVPFGGFPWLLIGYSQTDSGRLMQIADITGVYGVSFLILWTNTALAWLAGKRALCWGSVWPMLISLALISCSLGYGNAAMVRWTRVVADHRVVMLQKNISVTDKPALMAWKFGEGYSKMAARIKPGEADLLVLPESPSPLSYQYDDSYRKMLRGLSARYPLGMIFNNIAFGEVGGETRYFNSAYFMRTDGTEAGRYDKMHLVPFGEYVPLKKLFFFMDSISKDVSDFYPGGDFRPILLQSHPVAAVICFEAVFPGLPRRSVGAGGQLIVNLTNDGWYGDTAAPYQHLAMARWRAVENRRYLIRATNSGISAVIEPTGRIQAATGVFSEEICTGRFAFLEAQSVYTRIGDLFAVLCVIIMSVFVLCCFRVAPSKSRSGSLETASSAAPTDCPGE